MKINHSEKLAAQLTLILTIVIGTVYQLWGIVNLNTVESQLINTLWNVVLATIVGYGLLKTAFLEQFKHLPLKKLLWGIPLTIIVGITAGLLYAQLFGKATTNPIKSVVTFKLLLLIPFSLLGEELLSTNVIIALEKMGLQFSNASIICSCLFALLHLTTYGANFLQLFITLIPTRLALNYIWQKSNSVWISLICHYAFDCLGILL